MLTPHERLRCQLALEAIVATAYRLDEVAFRWVVKDCDYPPAVVTEEAYAGFDPKGFWRVDKDKTPEQRFTVLSLMAFLDLQSKIQECNSDRDAGIIAFCQQNNGEGWMLPETLRIADYGLGHDERAQQHQPVRSHFGPRFYEWQLAQSPEESWRECHLHACNLLVLRAIKRCSTSCKVRFRPLSSIRPRRPDQKKTAQAGKESYLRPRECRCSIVSRC